MLLLAQQNVSLIAYKDKKNYAEKSTQLKGTGIKTSEIIVEFKFENNEEEKKN